MCFVVWVINTLDLDKIAHLLICISVFITKLILTNRVVGDNKSGRSLHTFSLAIRIHGLNQEYTRHKRHTTAIPHKITPAKKIETVRGVVG